MPIQGTELEILCQRESDQIDGIIALARCHICCRPGSVLIANDEALAKIGVILDFIYGNAQGGMCLLVVQHSLNAGVENLIHIVIIPPEVTGMIMPLIEGRIKSVEERFG